MTELPDPLLLPLAGAAAACYDHGAPFAWQNATRTAHMMHLVVNEVNTFVFAGTMDLQEWLVDLFALQVPVITDQVLGWVHAGFLIDAQAAVRDYIVPKLNSLGWPPCYVTGHSKGAAEAILVHGLLKAAGHPPLATRAFEPPRVGGADLERLLAGDDFTWTQTWNTAGDDIITHVPCGPTWRHPRPPLRLAVPDAADLVTKHKIPAVLAALAAAAPLDVRTSAPP